MSVWLRQRVIPTFSSGPCVRRSRSGLIRRRDDQLWVTASSSQSSRCLLLMVDEDYTSGLHEASYRPGRCSMQSFLQSLVFDHRGCRSESTVSCCCFLVSFASCCYFLISSEDRKMCFMKNKYGVTFKERFVSVHIIFSSQSHDLNWNRFH